MDYLKVLAHKINSINARDYGAYQSLQGEYNYPEFKFIIDQIPKDPYAPPHTGIYRVRVKNHFNDWFDTMFNSKISRVAFRDFLARSFYNATFKKTDVTRGTGNSGLITIDPPGQAILERSSVLVNRESIEVRFFIGLPANGRKINAQICRVMLLEELPQIVKLAFFPQNTDLPLLEKHIKTTEDAEYIRSSLKALNLVAFIADNSLLPRKSGSSDEPLGEEDAIPFKSPASLKITIDLPHAGLTTGAGIPKGTTLIVGGGYHGKSTLLNAIEMGIYNHIPGDGREKCISDASIIKIRASSGRSVKKVDISTFINNLPLQRDTRRFSTENASGSTSQAASIMEAIEAGTRALLMDEDTCATNFMIRDQKMQKLVHSDDEPITTYIDVVKKLYSQSGISTILVLGGTGDYFDVSDLVIQMKNYNSIDVTGKAHEIASSISDKRQYEGQEDQIKIYARALQKGCINPYNNYSKKSIYATEINRIHFGKNTIDITDCEQLIELAQTKAIAEAILYINRYVNGKATIKEIIDSLMSDLARDGLDILSSRITGHFAQFRSIDLAFAINRLRELEIE